MYICTGTVWFRWRKKVSTFFFLNIIKTKSAYRNGIRASVMVEIIQCEDKYIQ